MVFKIEAPNLSAPDLYVMSDKHNTQIVRIPYPKHSLKFFDERLHSHIALSAIRTYVCLCGRRRFVDGRCDRVSRPLHDKCRNNV